ncbi:MAG: MmgE/PrpD family protein, partial [Pseudomonadota bacterium]
LREKGVVAEEIQHVTLTAPPLIHRLVGRPIMPDMSVNYARLCFQYSGAVALRKGRVELEDFEETELRDSETLELGQKIQVIDDGSPDPAAFTPQIAVARLNDGREVEARIDTLYGAPNDPMSEQAHLEKFHRCVAFGFGADQPNITRKLIELTENLEAVPDVSVLSRLAAGLET